MNIQTLKQSVRGTVTSRADGDYETVRAGLLWNGRKPDRFPEIVVRAKDAADVQAAVRFAAATGRRVSPRGGGHNFSGIALQAGVIIDLSEMNGLEIDPQTHTAWAQPAVTNGRFATALAEKGLAFPTGHCASVPLSGYLLGGGFGWNAGVWGIACHSVESVEVVLADGSLVTANERENSDIFWAVRGGGPEFFGVVTRYRLRVYDLPRAIRTSVWTFAIEDAGKVEQWMSDVMRRVPRHVEFTAAMSSAPPPLAGKASKTIAAVATVFAATEAEAQATTSLLEVSAPQGALDVQLFMETPFEVLYLMIGQFFPEGRRYLTDTNWSTDAGALIGRLAEAIEKAPSAESFALGVVLPPPDGKPMPSGVFSMAGPVFSATYAIWQGEEHDQANFAWLRRTSAGIAPISLGHYLGEADLDAPGHLDTSYAPAALQRLKQLQRKYDPTGLFRPHEQAEALRKAG